MAESPTDELNRLDVEKEQKRARSLLKTAEGRQALRDVTGYNFIYADDSQDKKLPIVAVLTPSRNGFKPETNQAFIKMVEASRGHATIYPEPAVSASIVHWVRNDLLAKLYKSAKPFDFVLLMDDDMDPEPEALNKLLAHDKDIVAAGCTVRSDPPRPNFRVWNQGSYSYSTAFQWDGNGLMKIGGVGTGFMLIKRLALEKIADYYLSCQHEKRFLLSPLTIKDGVLSFEPYDESRLPDWLKNNIDQIEELRYKTLRETFDAWWFECLKQPNHTGEYGEDLSFCFKAQQLGFDVWVDTTVRVGHLGTYSYSLADFKDYQEGLLKEETHRQMLCAVIGKQFDAPKIEQPFVQTGKISVLIPSRGRRELLTQTITALFTKATGDIEILVRLDDDDHGTTYADWYPKIRYDPNKLIVSYGPSHGYRGMHLYNNELAALATGDWLLPWSDDAVIETEGWDEKIRACGGGWKVLNAGVVTPAGKDYSLNLFPISTRKIYETLGHLSLQTHSDSWMQVISRVCGIEQKVDLDIRHLREELDDDTKRKSLATYRQSSPEFFSEKFQRLLYDDVMKVKEALKHV